MFMQRLITSIILIPLVVLLLFYGPAWLLLGLVILILLVSGSECWQLIPAQHPAAKIGFLLLLGAGLWASAYIFSYWLALGLFLWAFIVIAILTFPKSQKYWGHAPIIALTCFVLLTVFVHSLIHLYYLPAGKGLILYLLCIVWAADIGAYLAGKQWGAHKLIPQVSPGKSWEGALGGLLLVFIVTSIGFYYFQPQAFIAWFLLALVTAISSIFGDLFISVLKRRRHLKDTGTLIPGHGGILDRLDSVIAAMPLFYFGVHYLVFPAYN